MSYDFLSGENVKNGQRGNSGHFSLLCKIPSCGVCFVYYDFILGIYHYLMTNGGEKNFSHESSDFLSHER